MSNQREDWMRERRERDQARFRLLMDLRLRLHRARSFRNWTVSIFLVVTAATLAANWQWTNIQLFTPLGAIGILTVTGFAAGASQMLMNDTRTRIEHVDEVEY